MAQVANVHFHAGELDGSSDDPKGFDRLDFGMEEAITHARPVNHVGLAFGEFAVALYGGVVAPDGRGQNIATDGVAG